MYNNGEYYSGSPTLTGVTFSGNSAADRGGGMYNNWSGPTLSGVTFSGNSALGGGGMCTRNPGSLSLINVIFSGNSAVTGGGLLAEGNSPTLRGVIFGGNSAGYGGGGMFNGDSSPTLTNVTFSGNSADNGGGMRNDSSDPTLVNVTFSGNSAGAEGSAIYNSYSSATLANCILWGNIPTTTVITNAWSSTAAVTYSDIQGGWTGETNINVNPRFVADPYAGDDGTWGTPDDDYGDLRLRPGSPAIDAGNNSAVPAGVTTDLGGGPRFVDVPSVPDTGSGTPPIVDMGAYEALPPIFLPLVLRAGP